MKIRNVLLVLMLLVLVSVSASAKTKKDVILLKNGKVVEGKIVAQEFNASVQICTADGSVLTFQMDEVEMINTEGKDASVGARKWMKRGAIEMIAGSEYSFAPFSMRKDRRVLREVEAARVDLTEIAIPDSATVIGDETFRLCPKLTEVTIPNTVTVIGERAFICCPQLRDIIIPESVISIGYGTFSYCWQLTNIYSLNPEPPTCGDMVFYGVDKSTCILHVPEGSREAYSAASTWSDFKNIVEME